MLGDVDAAGNPDLFLLGDVIHEFSYAQSAAGTASKAAMQAYSHHLGCALLAFLIEAIECVFQILVKMLTRVEALRCGKAHVIGVKRVWYDEMLFAVRLGQEIRQIIGIVIR